jgi:hypothetical protein
MRFSRFACVRLPIAPLAAMTAIAMLSPSPAHADDAVPPELLGDPGPKVELAPEPAPSAASIEAEPPRERPVPSAVYVVGGASLAAFGAGVGIGVLAMKEAADYRRMGGEHSRDAGVAYARTADVLVISAIVGLGVTTYLYLSRPERARPAQAASLPLSFTF